MNKHYVAGHRFQNILITVGMSVQEVANKDKNSAAVCTFFPGQPKDVQRFDCSSRMYGRYVRISKLNFNSFLNVYEVEVIGY